jgi:hypothetical protein
MRFEEAVIGAGVRSRLSKVRCPPVMSWMRSIRHERVTIASVSQRHQIDPELGQLSLLTGAVALPGEFGARRLGRHGGRRPVPRPAGGHTGRNQHPWESYSLVTEEHGLRQ